MKLNTKKIINKSLVYGFNEYTKEKDKFSIYMDTGVLKLKKGDTYTFKSNTKEKAILIWNGKVKITFSNNQNTILHRKDFWKDFLMAIHGSKNETFIIKALEESEMVLQAKINTKNFETKIYNKSNCKVTLVGSNYEPSVSLRYVIDVFNYDNAPYSNMVLGEVFSMPGHWSGFPSHKHDQPEIYIYRFDREHGFGIGILDVNALIVKEKDAMIIPPKTMHSNASAPGYQMYFVWMIAHLKNNPWITREYDVRHKWLNEKNLKIESRNSIIKNYGKN